MEKGVNAIEGTHGKVEKVKLTDGTEIKADLVLIGTGISPNTGFIKGLNKETDGSLSCNPFL